MTNSLRALGVDAFAMFKPDETKPQAASQQDPYKWLILDGGGLAVTAWATHRHLEHVEDRIRAGIYVLITTISSLSRLTDDHARVVVVWDGKDNRAYRRGLHPWYKYGRGSVINRDEVRIIVEQVGQLLECIGIAQSKMDGCEADDVVATIARAAAEWKGENVLVFSDDKDYLQSITTNVHLMRRSLQGIILSQEQCEVLGHSYGYRYLCIKALMGDSGDNIRGLSGIGEKKAIDIVDTIPTLFEDLETGNDVDWTLLEKNTYRALVRAGRRLVSPAKLSKNGLAFARKFTHDRGLPLPVEFEVPDAVCLAEAAWEALNCFRLVRLNDEMPHDKLHFPRPNVERIPSVLAKLDMSAETDLISSMYTLAGMRDPSITPPRAAGVRSGGAIRNDGPAPSNEAF